MKPAAWPLALLGLCSLTALIGLSQYAPPAPQKVDPAVIKTIEDRTDKLRRQLDRLVKLGVKDPILAEVEIFHKAADYIAKYNEFYHKDSAAWTLAMLDRGFLRASQAASGESPWLSSAGFSVARAYRSAVDGSVQPFAVTYPADYGKNAKKKWRVDVVLHGRNPALTEVEFLHAHSSEKPAPRDLNHVQIDIYGRGNNAYRWAGESDVNEAIDAFLFTEQKMGRSELIDPGRFVLRGFSMGGAGTWHLGLHFPGRWCVIGPGAGFTTTHGYVKDLPDPLPPYQEACLSVYDAVDYAENAGMVPVVAYAGADDPQLAAAKNIEERLKPRGIPMTLLVAPGTAHSFPPEWQAKAESDYAKYVARGRNNHPKKVRFVTYTLKYPRCDWVEILSLDKHYHKAVVEAEWSDGLNYKVKTSNVRALDIRLASGASKDAVKLIIDGQSREIQPQGAENSYHLFLERKGEQWHSVLLEKLAVERLRYPQKGTNLTGPIDDAFVRPFLCVAGTGEPWHKATAAYAEANLERFKLEWSKYMRGELPVKNDTDVTPDDIGFKNLILFGDPASNSLIDQVMSGLPFQWTRDKITWEGQEYSAAGHVPVLVYPSPINANFYVVLNSGHTFHAEDFTKTNAMLFPRLGDHALLKCSSDDKKPLAVQVISAGLFDDFWRMRP